MATTLSDPVLGTVVDGRYEVLRRIARGGMATVYLAHDRRLDRRVALKMMHPHLADGSDVVARFRREARASARLAHPNVVNVFDQGAEGETSYLTMEYVDGATLRRAVTARGSLPLGEALDVLDAVLDALAAAHRAGVVHRDVKPENVLIARDGTVKVADFGLARAVTEATMGSTGSLLGTVAYLSPEIVTSGSADARADVYAAGVMLYEMLTGRQPFEGDTPIQVAYQHVHASVPAPSDDVAWLPIEVDDYVALLTAHAVEDRPDDAGVALAALRRIREDFDERVLLMRADVEPDEVAELEAEATAQVELEANETRRHATGTVALPIGVVPSTEETRVAHALRRRRRGRRLRVALVLVLVLATLGGGAWWYLAVGPGAWTTVPDVVGDERVDALTAIEAAELVATTSAAHDDEVPAGQVISTEPGPGEDVARGGEVAVLVSSGIQQIEVPDVAGTALEDAQTALRAEGLDGTVTLDRTWHAEVPAGDVISLDPEPGEVVDHDAALTIQVSEGREPVSIPSVVNTEQDAAIAEIDRAGGEGQVNGEEFSDDVPAGFVIRQDVTGNAFRGDPVRLVVSLGPELFEVPDVVGDQYDAAAAELEDLGFVVERQDTLGGFFGTVRLQDVEAGSMQPRGTVITLTVV